MTLWSGTAGRYCVFHLGSCPLWKHIYPHHCITTLKGPPLAGSGTWDSKSRQSWNEEPVFWAQKCWFQSCGSSSCVYLTQTILKASLGHLTRAFSNAPVVFHKPAIPILITLSSTGWRGDFFPSQGQGLYLWVLSFPFLDVLELKDSPPEKKTTLQDQAWDPVYRWSHWGQVAVTNPSVLLSLCDYTVTGHQLAKTVPADYSRILAGYCFPSFSAVSHFGW